MQKGKVTFSHISARNSYNAGILFLHFVIQFKIYHYICTKLP